MRKRVYIAGPISRGDLAHNIRQAEAAFFALARAGFAPFCPHWSVYSTGPRVGWYTREDHPDERIDAGPFQHGTYAAARPNGGGGMTHADWLGVDIPWIEAAECVLRLPGESAGADAECRHATDNGIPVYDSIETLLACQTKGA